jgi:hypothetical protein
VHDFLSERQARERIQQAPGAPVSFIVKNFSPMDKYLERRLAETRA